MNAKTYSVLVFDMAHTGEPGAERRIDGFVTLAAARAYAEARVRSSVEELRSRGQSSADLKALWYLYGEDCSVIGGGYKGHAELDRYIAVEAGPEEINWKALEP